MEFNDNIPKNFKGSFLVIDKNAATFGLDKCMIFHDKEALLRWYNKVNIGTRDWYIILPIFAELFT